MNVTPSTINMLKIIEIISRKLYDHELYKALLLFIIKD